LTATPRLAGKRAIVTGAASGIGRAALSLFAREGARVLAVDRAAGLDAAAAEARAGGGAALAVAADAGDEAAVAGVVGRCVAEWGGVDVVFANAGVSGGRVPLLEQTVEQWQEILRVNLIGP
jgi:NAD(P)-dependent dehydrogenase (short-subunit alcohol dehydrogenase family)